VVGLIVSGNSEVHLQNDDAERETSSSWETEIWNGSLGLASRVGIEADSVADEYPVGMRHLCYIQAFDSMAMSNGLSEALRYSSLERMAKMASGCDYFGLTGLASLVRRLAANHEDYAGAERLNVEYWEARGRVPGESLIEAALEQKLRAAPQDFGLEP
jgi:hypothetical protein